MSAAVWIAALVRAGTSGLVVVIASVLAEAAGPFWGALVVSLPVASGPAYVFMAMEHDGAFIAGAALNGFAANAATGLFLTVYALRARGHTLGRALGPAVLAWIAAAVPIAAASWTPPTALLLNVVVYGLAVALTRTPSRTVVVRDAAAARPRWFDLLARALAVALFVSAVLGASAALGPARTGIVAAYPVTVTSTLVILHRRLGGAAMEQLAANAIRGVFGFGLTLLALHLLAVPFGAARALLGALAVSILWSAGLLVRQRLAPAPPNPR